MASDEDAMVEGRGGVDLWVVHVAAAQTAIAVGAWLAGHHHGCCIKQIVTLLGE